MDVSAKPTVASHGAPHLSARHERMSFAAGSPAIGVVHLATAQSSFAVGWSARASATQLTAALHP